MQRLRRFSLLSLLLSAALLLAACGGGDDGPTTPTPPSDAAVLAAGWAAFTSGDLADAESEFRELLRRGALLAVAHDGLGWTFARQSRADSALAHFELALTNGAAGMDIADQTHAGLAFALDAAGQHAASLAAVALVGDGWVFAHDEQITHDDVVLLMAIAHYALGDFGDSLAAVQRLDPSFDADVTTAAGRALLAAKIEALQG